MYSLSKHLWYLNFQDMKYLGPTMGLAHNFDGSSRVDMLLSRSKRVFTANALWDRDVK